jgi:aldose 1-epimerase
LITIDNDNGLSISLSDFGARITSVKKFGHELILGFDRAEDYQETYGDAVYYGAIVGRVAGRIKGAKSTIADQLFEFTANEDGKNTLHGGGPNGLHDRKWDYELIDTSRVRFTTEMSDGLHGFPGTVTVQVDYYVTEDNSWGYEIRASTDQTTLWNPCNHVYYNLTGDAGQTIDRHRLIIAADSYEPLEHGLPSLAKQDVTGSLFDFRKGNRLGNVINDQEEAQIADYQGLDHPFFLDDTKDIKAILISPNCETRVEMRTNQPSVVIFTENFGDVTPIVRGTKLVHHGGITFETQVAPGAEQNEALGNLLLHPGEIYYNQTEFAIH